MAEVCEVFDSCELFTQGVANLPSTSKSFKTRYCQQDPDSCARYLVQKKLGRDLVPKDLFPNERGRALKLIDLD